MNWTAITDTYHRFYCQYTTLEEKRFTDINFHFMNKAAFILQSVKAGFASPQKYTVLHIYTRAPVYTT